MFEKIKCFILDMDGTIYLGNELFSFTKDFLKKVEETGREYYFFTNNSSKSQQDYIEKLERFGIRIKRQQMMTSTHVISRYLKQHYEGKSVYVVGTPSLIQEFQYFGINVTEEDPDIVLLGFDTTLNYEKLKKACYFIRNGCIFFGMNEDLNCPMEGGTFIPDCGSMSIMLKNATGKEPFFIGKPEPIMVNCVLKKLGVDKEDAVIVGDRLYTDIKTGINAKIDTICVLSGEAEMKDILEGEIKPDYIFDSVKEIYEKLTEVENE